MAGKQKFYLCSHCGNMIGMLEDAGVPIECCGEAMDELVANTTDAAQEKHVPVVSVDGDTVSVSVGSTHHPMEAAHNIAFIYVETENGGQRKKLSAGDPPTATFKLLDDKAISVYAYCNLHGLWSAEI